jgi:hypothetical protein
MKNLLENIAPILVLILSIAIIFFIVQFNLIEEDNDSDDTIIMDDRVDKKHSTENYLNRLEVYGDDKDIQVNAQDESDRNTRSIQSEVKDDAFDKAINDKYSKENEPKKLAEDKREDKVASAIDALDL